MDENAPGGEIASLRYLKWLVTILLVVLIAGFVTIVALFVIRLGQVSKVTLPDQITLPAGQKATAFTQGQGWYAVVTDKDEILIFDGQTGKLRQTIAVKAE